MAAWGSVWHACVHPSTLPRPARTPGGHHHLEELELEDGDVGIRIQERYPFSVSVLSSRALSLVLRAHNSYVTM